MNETNPQATEPRTTESAGPEKTPSRVVHVPRVDVAESKDSFLVVADLPGVSQEDVEVTVEKNVLTIAARAEARVPEGYEHRFGGRAPVEWRRSFTLGDAIDREAIAATMKNGILRLTLPKASRVLPRRISVRAA
ncbi:Hsp20/alpha crystallin family protein [bacterium]|nr:Hsp20/alpha crystallin family protein [bacterium]